MIAVRPPEYWPRLEFFALVDRVDRFVLADTFQYSRQSYQNRAKLRTPDGWQWISVPLRGGQHGRPACDVVIEGDPYWMRKHWRAFIFNYQSTPFFEYYEPALRPLFDAAWHRLADLTCATVETLHRLLGLSSELVRASTLDGAPDELRDVVTAAGGGPLLVASATAAHDAARVGDVRVLHYDHPSYRQNFDGFVPGMSALDVLFNYGPESRTILRGGGRIVEPG